jgi:hypothetical protein
MILVTSQKHIAVATGALLLIGLAILMIPHQKPDLKAARRLVKTSTDSAAREISLDVKDISIDELVAMKAPNELGERRGEFERTIWRIHGTLETIEKKKDGDFYLVMRGEHGGHTVVEVPDPELCQGSPVEGSISSTRSELEKKYHPTSEKKEVNEPATVEGVGFYGFGSGSKSGSSGNTGARLMPGTSIEIGQ